MAGIAIRKPLPLEDVPEMGAAARALDLDALAVGIGQPSNRARDLLVERGPPAVSVELVLRPEEGGAASLAFVQAGVEEAVVFPGERHLRPFV